MENDLCAEKGGQNRKDRKGAEGRRQPAAGEAGGLILGPALAVRRACLPARGTGKASETVFPGPSVGM